MNERETYLVLSLFLLGNKRSACIRVSALSICGAFVSCGAQFLTRVVKLYTPRVAIESLYILVTCLNLDQSLNSNYNIWCSCDISQFSNSFPNPHDCSPNWIKINIFFLNILKKKLWIWYKSLFFKKQKFISLSKFNRKSNIKRNNLV